LSLEARKHVHFPFFFLRYIKGVFPAVFLAARLSFTVRGRPRSARCFYSFPPESWPAIALFVFPYPAIAILNSSRAQMWALPPPPHRPPSTPRTIVHPFPHQRRHPRKLYDAPFSATKTRCSPFFLCAVCFSCYPELVDEDNAADGDLPLPPGGTFSRLLHLRD